MSAAVTDLRLRRGAEHVCRLGPCALAELLAEVGAQHGIHDEVVRALAAYQRVTPGMLRAA
ncbi:hypothetical protein M0638_28570, partial [Roseomonas sp. NAR14]